jgi:hypothetical protein
MGDSLIKTAAMQKIYNTVLTGYRRVDDKPLEANTLFSSYEDAANYAKNDPTAYPGQIISVSNARGSQIYIITPSYDLETNSKEIVPVDRLKDQVVVRFSNTDSVHIEHSLGYRPSVVMTDDSGESLTAAVRYPDANAVDVSWNGSMSGYIYLV